MPWLTAALLAGAAGMNYPGRSYALLGLLLFLPLLDRRWSPPPIFRSIPHRAVWGMLLASATGLIVWQPQYAEFALVTLITAALPEEWFFRAYFMTRIGAGLWANLFSSALFSLLHGLTWGWNTALLVFIPSLFYGWLYQKTRDLVLLILVHALSNLVYVGILSRYLPLLPASSPG